MTTQAKFIWRPSVARTVCLEGFGPTPRGSTWTNVPPLIWPPKDPADVLDYVLDVSDALVGNDDDTIATLDVSIFPANPGDLALASSYAEGEKAILWLSGGQAGTTYGVTISIGTTNGRTLYRTVSLPVVALSNPGVAAAVIVDQNGNPLLDQNGNAITTGP